MSRRPKNGSFLQVYLSRSESEEWAADPAARRAMLNAFGNQAQEKGKRFFQVFSASGAELTVGGG